MASKVKMTQKLEDIFAGRLELNARERAFVLHLLEDWYVGSECNIPGVANRLTFIKGIISKFSALALDRMVTPDGSRLVSVAEHDAMADADAAATTSDTGDASTGDSTEREAHAFEARADGSLVIYATMPDGDGEPIRVEPHRVRAVLAACGDALAQKRSMR